MDLKLTANEPSPAERRAVDALLDPPAGAGAAPPAAGGERLRAERGGAAVRHQRHRLLPALWALVDRVGHISPEGLVYVARRLGVPPAEVYGVATFYAMLPVTPRPATSVAHVCVDLSCRLAGEAGAALRARLGAHPDLTVVDSPCLGLCERAPAALVTTAGVTVRERVVAPATPSTIDTDPDEPAPAAAVPQAGEPGLALLRRAGKVDAMTVLRAE